MCSDNLIEPDDSNVNIQKNTDNVINNYIKTSSLLFNLQTKYNNEISKKVDMSSYNNLTNLLILNLSEKIDNFMLFNGLLLGTCIVTIGILLIKKSN